MKRLKLAIATLKSLAASNAEMAKSDLYFAKDYLKRQSDYEDAIKILEAAQTNDTNTGIYAGGVEE
jgi:tetratricopeptide (TPR) repeat protein